MDDWKNTDDSYIIIITRRDRRGAPRSTHIAVNNTKLFFFFFLTDAVACSTTILYYYRYRYYFYYRRINVIVYKRRWREMAPILFILKSCRAVSLPILIYTSRTVWNSYWKRVQLLFQYNTCCLLLIRGVRNGTDRQRRASVIILSKTDGRIKKKNEKTKTNSGAYTYNYTYICIGTRICFWQRLARPCLDKKKKKKKRNKPAESLRGLRGTGIDDLYASGGSLVWWNSNVLFFDI